MNKIQGKTTHAENEYVIKNGVQKMEFRIPDKFMRQKFYLTEIFSHELQRL